MLVQYLKAKLKLLIMLGCFISVFAAIFFLYELPVAVVLYAALICAVIGFFFALTDYLRFCRRHRSISQLKSAITITADDLPMAANLIERDYGNLIKTVVDDKRLLTSRYEHERAEIIDYYTLWVHQIKTPISAMRLILQAQDSQQSRELEAQLFITEQYVDMVLAYLRTGSDSTDYILKEYYLEDIIKQTVRKYAPMFIRKKIGLELQHISTKVLTDEKWLCFAIEQILSNAVKYTNQGCVCVYIENGSTVVIRDTGIGIAPEDLPRVFEKGFTGYNGRADKRASGIGLYLTKQVLSKLGHSIAIQSELNIGTTVRIDLSTKRLIPN